MSPTPYSDAPGCGPVYVEGWPVFDIFRAQAAWTQERKICRYQDRQGIKCGGAFIERCEDELELRFAFRNRYISYVSDTAVFQMEQVPNGVDSNRHFLRCPSCSKRIRCVYFKSGKWACRRCQKLLHRRQVVSERTLNTEKRDELARLLRRGRPHYMRNDRYRLLVAELEELKRSLRKHPPAFASEEHSYFVEPVWEKRPSHGEYGADWPDEELIQLGLFD